MFDKYFSGHTDKNPGTQRNSCRSQRFSICHWNLNTHSFAIISLLTADRSVNKFDIENTSIVNL